MNTNNPDILFFVQLLYFCFQFSFKSIKGNFIRAKRITKLVCKLCHFSTFSGTET